MTAKFARAFLIILFGVRAPAIALGVSLEWVTVGDPGNPTDPFTGSVRGSVADSYRLSAFEITNAQYAEFLNAVAGADPHGLYSGLMGWDPRYGGITKSGTAPNCSYAVKDNFASKPVTYVNWYDAARFCNWLHNGQPSGPRANTEAGAYNMSSAFPERNPDALYFLPTWDEWYKAAYHDPRTEAEGGPPGDDHYWRFPTRSDSPPASVAPPGGTNSANTAFNGDNLTEAVAYTQTTSFYGAFDMAGNVWEWTEEHPQPEFRTVIGGSFVDRATGGAHSDSPVIGQPPGGGEARNTGFRVASVAELPTRLTAISFDSLLGEVTITLIASAGQNIVLEWSNDLSEWDPLPGPFEQEGDLWFYRESVALTPGKRFFRLVRGP